MGIKSHNGVSPQHLVPMTVGTAVAMLSIPIAITLDMLDWLIQFSLTSQTLIIILWFIGMSLCAYAGYLIIRSLPINPSTADELARYTLIGVFNITLNVAILDILILLTERTEGQYVILFSAFAYAVTVTQSFYWNRYWIFRKKPALRAYHAFVLFASIIVAGTTLSIGLVHIMVNIIGAPQFFTQTQWANIAILCTIPISFATNFFGAKIIVFRS